MDRRGFGFKSDDLLLNPPVLDLRWNCLIIILILIIYLHTSPHLNLTCTKNWRFPSPALICSPHRPQIAACCLPNPVMAWCRGPLGSTAGGITQRHQTTSWSSSAKNCHHQPSSPRVLLRLSRQQHAPFTTSSSSSSWAPASQQRRLASQQRRLAPPPLSATASAQAEEVDEYLETYAADNFYEVRRWHSSGRMVSGWGEETSGQGDLTSPPASRWLESNSLYHQPTNQPIPPHPLASCHSPSVPPPQILGVSETASTRQIKRAYKRMMKDFHPGWRWLVVGLWKAVLGAGGVTNQRPREKIDNFNELHILGYT